MAKMQVIGYRNVSFKDDKTNKEITGISIYTTCEDDRVTGLMAEKLFLGNRILSDTHYTPKVGDIVVVSYNKYGKPDDIQLVGSAGDSKGIQK